MPPKQPEIIILSKIPDVRRAFFLAEEGAKIRGRIGYLIKPIGDNKFRVTLIRGELDDLLMAVKKTPFLELVEGIGDENESVDVDLSDL